MQLVKLDKTANVRVPIPMTEACYELTEVEQKILYAIAKNLGSSEKAMVNISALAEFCNFPVRWARRYVVSSMLKLMNRHLEYIIDGELWHSHWIQSAKECKDGGHIEFYVDKNLLPCFRHYARHYASFPVQELMSLSGQYTQRVYALIKAYHKSHERELLITDIIKMFALEKTAYAKNLSSIIQRIIKPSVESINKETDLIVEFETKRAGRKLYSVVFRWKKKASAARAERRAAAAKKKENQTSLDFGYDELLEEHLAYQEKRSEEK